MRRDNEHAARREVVFFSCNKSVHLLLRMGIHLSILHAEQIAQQMIFVHACSMDGVFITASFIEEEFDNNARYGRNLSFFIPFWLFILSGCKLCFFAYKSFFEHEDYIHFKFFHSLQTRSGKYYNKKQDK